MHGSQEQGSYDPLLDVGSLRARPSGELWRIWWRVGRVLLTAWAMSVPLWLTRARQRDDLRDLGLTPGQAAREAEKWFWQG